LSPKRRKTRPPHRTEGRSLPRWIVPFAYGLAFLSGAAALVYQVAWVKMMALTFGSTTGAAAAVIGSFMAGMGLGARGYAVLERFDRNAFRLYGFIELGIAAGAVFVTVWLYDLPALYAGIKSALGDGPLLEGVRLAIAFGILLVPAALMGATFPALCAALIRRSDGLERHLGPIYGVNTLGAAAGALIAGFVLVELLGNRSAVHAAAGVNLVCALGGLWLSRTPQLPVEESAAPHAPPEGATGASSAGSSLPLPLLGAVLLGSGFATMAYEIFWFRAMKYVIGNSTYAMSLVLAIFLVGLALGGIAHRWLGTKRKPERNLALVQAGIALAALAAIGALAQLLSSPEWSAKFSVFAPEIDALPWQSVLARAAAVAVAILLPPAVLMGLAFPMASALYVRRITRLGKEVGTAYLLANIGSIAGVVVGGLILLPKLGIIGATCGVASFNLALALGVSLRLRRTGGGGLWPVAACTLLAIGAMVALPPALGFRGNLEQEGGSRLLFWEEDELATVKVLARPETDARAMTIDGYLIGGNLEFGQGVGFKQLLLAHLPMALKPDTRRTLNIGLGSGGTMNALGSYPGVEELETVEISPAVVRGAAHFDEGAVLDDPRAKVHVGDAVHHLLAHEESYDLIISDGKQNPKFAGNAAILSREMYELARTRLAPGGLFVQWIPIGMPPRAFRIILETFIDTFPETNVFHYPPMLVLFVGSESPLAYPSAEAAYASFPVGSARHELSRFEIDHSGQLLSGRITGQAGLRRVLGEDAEVNTWDHPLLEFVPFKEFEAEEGFRYVVENMLLLMAAGKTEAAREKPRAPAALAPFLASSDAIRAGFADVMTTGQAERLEPALQRAARRNPADSRPERLRRRIPFGMPYLMLPGIRVPDGQDERAEPN
jgi:spermidine synthase